MKLPWSGYLVSISLLIGSFSAQAMSDQAYLRKASLRARGVPSFPFERRKGPNQTRDEATRAMIVKYTESSAFRDKMARRVYELMKIPTEVANVSVVADLVEYVLKTNRPWDEIYRATSFPYVLRVDSMRSEDSGDGFKTAEQIYEFINKRKTGDSTYVLEPTESQSGNVAGIFTTPEFFLRYRTTKLNKNRTRGAALFRILLCDEMKQVADTSDIADNSTFLFSLGVAAPGTIATQTGDAHGTNPSCQSCHQKIDPAGRTMIGSSVVLSPRMSEGALVFINNANRRVEVPVEGINQFVREVMKQPEYTSCQVRYFWNWFIGEDIPLTSSLEKQIVRAFNSKEIGRRPKQFAQYLMSLPEFKSPKPIENDDVRFANVKPILKRCDSCHSGDPDAPMVSHYPFSIDGKANENMIKNIVSQTNLLGDEKKISMPPARAGWQLAESEKNLLKAWIVGGARDDDGKTQITRPYVSELEKKIPRPKSDSTSSMIATFDNTYFRYIDLIDLNRYKRFFGIQNETDFCNSRESASKFVLNAETGHPLLRAPTPMFFDAVNECGLYAPMTATHLAQVYGEAYEHLQYKRWQDMQPHERVYLARAIYDYMIGLDVYSKERTEQTIRAASAVAEQSTDPINGLVRFYTLTPDFLVY